MYGLITDGTNVKPIDFCSCYFFDIGISHIFVCLCLRGMYIFGIKILEVVQIEEKGLNE